MNLPYIVLNESKEFLGLLPYSESGKARVDRDYSGLSSFMNSLIVYKESIYWLNAYEK